MTRSAAAGPRPGRVSPAAFSQLPPSARTRWQTSRRALGSSAAPRGRRAPAGREAAAVARCNGSSGSRALAPSRRLVARGRISGSRQTPQSAAASGSRDLQVCGLTAAPAGPRLTSAIPSKARGEPVLHLAHERSALPTVRAQQRRRGQRAGRHAPARARRREPSAGRSRTRARGGDRRPVRRRDCLNPTRRSRLGLPFVWPCLGRAEPSRERCLGGENPCLFDVAVTP